MPQELSIWLNFFLVFLLNWPVYVVWVNTDIIPIHHYYSRNLLRNTIHSFQLKDCLLGKATRMIAYWGRVNAIHL